MIEPRQIRAARALLNWSQADLAKASSIAIGSIKNIENSLTVARKDSIKHIVEAFENAGIEFIDNHGVRLKSNDIEVFEGRERFEEFYLFMYDHLDRTGGNVCLSTGNEKLFREYRTDFEAHKRRMKALVESGRITFRVLATESYFTSTWAQYKWQPQQSTTPIAFYAFGQCLALISFAHSNPPYVVLHRSGPFAEAYRSAFEMAWANGKEPPRNPSK
jgi:transcriptional regulator with XRE-family HTH domain